MQRGERNRRAGSVRAGGPQFEAQHAARAANTDDGSFRAHARRPAERLILPGLVAIGPDRARNGTDPGHSAVLVAAAAALGGPENDPPTRRADAGVWLHSPYGLAAPDADAALAATIPQETC